VPYIGKQLVRGQNRKLDDISSGFNGSQTTFTLQIASQNVSVGSALQLWISVGGVIQNPLTDFTIAGNQITFTTAPAASLDFFGVIQGDVTDTNTPGDATVTTSKLSTGLTVNLADGSAATSSLQLGGTDSGLFSSAADKVNVTTGGVERLEIGNSEVVFNDGSNDVNFRVESNGNTGMLFVDGGNDRVGIGTTSPANNLDIAVDANNEGIQISSSTNVFGKIDFHANRSGADAALGILDFNWNNTQVARIIGGTGTDTTNKDDGVLQFHTAAAGSASEAMRIDSSGNVGIGTTSPGEDLHVFSSAGAIKIDSSGDSALRFAASGTNKFSIFQSGGTLRFFDNTNNAERMRIDSSGNVGIGTASPSTELHVAASSGYSELRLAGASGSGATVEFYESTTKRGDIYIDPSSNIVFRNTSERMRLDPSGRLLVGNTSNVATASGFNPSVQVAGTGAAAAISVGRYVNSTSPAQIVIQKSRGGVGVQTIVQSGDYLGEITFEGSNGSAFKQGAIVGAQVDGTPGSGDDMPGRLVFSTSSDGSSTPTERMRITSGGNVGIGDTSPGGRLDIGFNSSSVVGLVLSNAGTGTSARFYSGSSIVGSITVSGSATAFNTSSDYRLKENVVDIADGITRVKQLSPKRFNFIINADKTVDGFLAHEAQAVVPEAVTGEKDGEEMQGIDQAKLVPLLTAALQEAIAKIETLETEVAALKAG
jgi:hypothetical protein